MKIIAQLVPYCFLFKRVPILANLEKSLIIVRANKYHRPKNPMNIIKVIKIVG